MDQRVKEVIEGAMKNCQGDFKGLENHISSRIEEFNDVCYSKNSSNADRFADCMVEKNRKT
jgi:hypothetical protein